MSFVPIGERTQPAPAVEERAPRRKKKPRRKRRRWITIVLAAIGLALATQIVLWARYRTLYVVSVNALVKGRLTDIGAQLDGVVTSVEVEAGQQVRTGQVLVLFEDRQLQARVQRAQSQLEKATRELEVERLAIEQERKRLGSVVVQATAQAAAAKARSEAAKSQADDANDRFEVRQSLAQGGMIPQEELRSADAARRTAAAVGATAVAEQEAARAAKRLAEVEIEGLDVRQRRLVVLESDVAAYRAELALAEADLKATRILAPADGWVVRRIAEAGRSVVVGQPIVSLWIGRELWVEAWIDEDDLSQLQVGRPAQVMLKSYPHRVFHGVVESIGASTDYELPAEAVPQPRQSRMRVTPVVCARIRLAGQEGLLPGLSARVAIRKSRTGWFHTLLGGSEAQPTPPTAAP